MSKKILILGIDTVSHKNTHQLYAGKLLGYKMDVFTNDRLRQSSSFIQLPHTLFFLKPTFFNRFIQIVKYLIRESNNLNHVEIYPGGRFAYFYLILCKIFRCKVVTVERGEFVFWKERSRFVRFFLSMLYKKTSLVWYRELYMKKILDDIGVKKSFFLHNCTDFPKLASNVENKIDFLWVNRIIPQRKVDWVLKYFAEENSQRLVILGDKNKEPFVRDFIKTRNLKHISILGYLAPIPYYQKSRFFLLPADVVFANNALLEAMSYGVVPLVSDVSGSDLIVDHLQSGYIFPHNYQGFKEAIEWAIKLDKASYDKLSQNARLKVEKDFSFEKFKAGYKKMIDSI